MPDFSQTDKIMQGVISGDQLEGFWALLQTPNPQISTPRHHPLVAQQQQAINVMLSLVGILLLAAIFLAVTTGGYIGFAFSGYMMMAAFEEWEWVEANWVDDLFEAMFVSIERNLVYNLLISPIKELMSAFLFLEEENKFTPMNEY